MSEGEDEEGFSCHFLSFSTILPFDQSRVNLREQEKPVTGYDHCIPASFSRVVRLKPVRTL
jgi:hypothetical protein